MRFLIVFTVLAFLMLPLNAVADEISFKRNDKVLEWKTINNGNYGLPGKFGIDYNSHLSTTLNQTTGTADRWYDTVNNSADLTYNYSKHLDVIVSAKEDWSRDTMSRLGESLFTTDFSGGAVYKVRDGFSLKGLAGHLYDDRFENRDSGARGAGALEYRISPVKGLDLRFNSSAEKAAMKRSVDIVDSKGELAYRRGSTSLGLVLGNTYNKRGYFSDIDRKSIEKRKREVQDLTFSLERGDFRALTDTTAVSVDVMLARRIIDDSANDNERSSKYHNNAKGDERGVGLRLGRSFAGRRTVQWGTELSKSSNGVERESRRRDQTDIQTDTMIAFGFGRSDSVSVAGLIKRTRIDTPAGFANDRDELKLEGGILYTRDFHESLETALDFRIMETHYVNVDATQSSQNKWLKTYLLSPSLVYAPSGRFQIDHTVSVYANYISYDFEEKGRPRSNISRRMTSETWMDWRLSSRVDIRAGMMFEENDYGLLNLENERLPSEEGIKRFGDLSVKYRFSEWLTVTPQYIYAIRSDWEIDDGDLTSIRREVDQTFGLACRLFESPNGSIDASVRRIIRTTQEYPVRIRNYITLKINYRM